MLCEHRRTSFLCFMFRIPMLHSVRLTASCELMLRAHALLFYLIFFLVVTRITLSHLYFCEIIFASRSSAMRLSLPQVATRARASNSHRSSFCILWFRSSRSTLCLFLTGFDSRSTSLPPLRISPPRLSLFQDSYFY